MTYKSGKTQVALVKSDTYEYDSVKKSVKRCVGLFGGINRFINNGDKVLIKPNLLAAKPPDTAVTTHPAVVKAVVEIVKEAGAVPVIGDSPALGKWSNIIKKTGIADIAEETGASIIPFTDTIRISSKNNTFRHLEVAGIVKDVDAIINLPKLKTHAQMFLTLGVKNLYGFIVGKKKAKLHMEAGSDPLYFAKMLIDIYTSVKPSFTLIDGIVGMEGNGPGSGDVRPIGFLGAASDAVALDRVICEIIGAKKDKLYTTVVAEKQGAGETDMDKIEILGDPINSISVKDFKFPEIMDVEFGPKFLRRFIKDLITSWPKDDKKLCTLCKNCQTACPAEIIEIDAGSLTINYDKCIRCYCCVEVCPCGAMKVNHGRLARVLGLI